MNAHPRPSLPRQPLAVLFDRDGTLVVDVPYNADPEQVVPTPGARAALDRLREAGLALAVVSNQSGLGRGYFTRAQMEAVNLRIEEILGPLGPWEICPHAPGDGCECRKPSPTLVRRAAQRLSLDTAECVVVGDMGTDMEAARRAGAGCILIPTPATRAEDVTRAEIVARDLAHAVDVILGAGHST